jgi:phage-related protein
MSAQDELKATKEDIAEEDAVNMAAVYQKKANDAMASAESKVTDTYNQAAGAVSGATKEATKTVTKEYNKATDAIKGAELAAADAVTGVATGAEKTTDKYVKNISENITSATGL